VGLVEEFRKTILLELDFGAKGGMLIGLGASARQPGIVIPQVFWEYSAPRVLTIEYMGRSGIARKRSAAQRKDRPPHCRHLYEAFLKQIFEDGFFTLIPTLANLLFLPMAALDARFRHRRRVSRIAWPAW